VLSRLTEIGYVTAITSAHQSDS